MSCIRSCYDKDSLNFGHDDCPTCIHKDAPPQRTWVGLTDEDKKQIAKEANYNWEMTTGEYAERIGRLTEAKLKEKNR